MYFDTLFIFALQEILSERNVIKLRKMKTNAKGAVMKRVRDLVVVDENYNRVRLEVRASKELAKLCAPRRKRPKMPSEDPPTCPEAPSESQRQVEKECALALIEESKRKEKEILEGLATQIAERKELEQSVNPTEANRTIGGIFFKSSDPAESGEQVFLHATDHEKEVTQKLFSALFGGSTVICSSLTGKRKRKELEDAAEMAAAAAAATAAATAAGAGAGAAGGASRSTVGAGVQ
jgi:hypothetical protein